jgi:hypothetical protein
MSGRSHLSCQYNKFFFLFSEGPEDGNHISFPDLTDAHDAELPTANSDGGGPSTAGDGVAGPSTGMANTDGTSSSTSDIDTMRRKKRPKKISRKRVKGESSRQKNKRLRNSGEQYSNIKGKTVEKKVFENIPCNCRMKCYEKINEGIRKELFKSFYRTASFSTQNAFLLGLCHQSKPSTHRPRKGVWQRKQSVKYFLKFNENDETTTMQVCKQFFLTTFKISNGRLQRLLEKGVLGIPGSDKRGRHTPANKTSDFAVEQVCKHISSFPTVQSHYTRTHNPNRRYLATELNIKAMFHLYVDHCKANAIANPVSESMYRKIFNTKFNLHFKQPHKDTCKKCDLYKISIDIEKDPEKKKKIEIEHEVHLRKAEAARNILKDLREKCKENPKVYGLSFDLQKALPFPKLSVSIAYYKRNMYVYNLGCHELSSGTGFMYAWDETIGSRGTEEIASCVLYHIKQVVPPSTEHIVMFSDCCGGQNRSIKTAVAFMHFVQQDYHNIKVIDHKFMVSGHSFLPNDADFGVIEAYNKTRSIYDPDDWYEGIMKSKKKRPFHLKVMTQSEFISVESLLKNITKRKTNNLKEPVNWLKIQWLRYTRENPLQILYKESLNEEIEFCEINIDKTPRRGRPTNDFKKIQLQKLYTAPRPTHINKKKDMEDLLPFIPPVKHTFFTNLLVTPNAEEERPVSGSEDDDDE